MLREICGTVLVSGMILVGAPKLGAATYEAEAATLSGGASVATDHVGFTGTGFVGGYTDSNRGTAATTFSVTAPTADAYSLALRYANGTGATMTLSLYVGGTRLRQISLAATPDWDSWATSIETAVLPAGSSSIQFKFDTTDLGNVNLDSLGVSLAPPGVPDLVVTDLTLSPASPSVGDAVSFTATVANVGTAASPAGVVHGIGFSVDGVVVNWSDTFVSSLAAGASVTLTANAGPVGSGTWSATPGNHTVLANVDDVGRIAELNEGNNVMSRSFSVAGATLPDGLYRIRNMWQWNQYMFETAGMVAYGTPDIGDARSQWALVNVAPNVTLWNAATGRFMTLADVFNAGDPVRTSYTDTSAAAQFVVTPGTSAGFYTVQGVSQPCYLNLEGLAGFIQCFGIPPYWGSPQWAFERIGDVPARPAPTATPTPAPTPRLERYGANLPFTTYEAEDSRRVRTNGTVLAARRAWGQLTSEASGRRAVQLTSAEQYVELRLTEPAQGIVVRYSIPDSSNGAPYTAGLSLYVGGRKREIALTNKYSWLYGTWLTEPGQVRWSNNPNAVPRNPHRFFDDVAVRLDRLYPAGSTVRLVREASNTAYASTASITIDLIETEMISSTCFEPRGYAPITRYGAVANDGADDTAPLNSAIAAVTASHGALKGVWIPEGVFDLKNGVVGAAWNGSGTRVYLDRGIAIRGAGPWRSVLQGPFAGFYARAGNVTLSDLKIAATDVIRDDYNGVSGLEGNLTNSLVENVWFEHGKVGIWASNQTDGLRVVGCRIRNVWADGLNFHYGTSHSIVFNSHIRNTGDDGLAMWSDTFLDTGNAFLLNTVQIPNLANGIGIYGGKDNRVEGNLIADVVDNGSGISFGTNFNPPSITGRLTIAHNALVRTGSWHHDYGYAIGALWGLWAGSAGKIDDPTLTIASNVVADSTYSGILIEEPSVGASVTYASNTIVNPGTYGVLIKWTAAGTAAFNNNTVTNAGLWPFVNWSGLVVTGSGNNW